MIVKKAPKLNSVFFSNNEMIIHVASEIGSNHFFEIEILVDDVVFDKQSWSKINDIDCFINLRGLFDNIFTNNFEAPTSIGLVRKDSLFKKITVSIKEYNVTTSLIVNETVLPDFYVLQNNKSAAFNDSEEVVLLSELSSLNKIDSNSILSIPLWINKESITVQVLDNNGLEKFGDTISTSKGMYEFQIPISEINTSGLNFLQVIIDSSIDLTYYLKDHFRYDFNQIAVRNVYGFFEFASFFGKITKRPKYSRTIQQDYKDKSSIVDQNNKMIYTLNTGYLSENQRSSVDSLNRSIDSYFLEDGLFKDILITTSSGLLKQTDVYSGNNVITFEDNYIVPVDESNKYDVL